MGFTALVDKTVRICAASMCAISAGSGRFCTMGLTTKGMETVGLTAQGAMSACAGGAMRDTSKRLCAK
jgi:hypothetical protein